MSGLIQETPAEQARQILADLLDDNARPARSFTRALVALATADHFGPDALFAIAEELECHVDSLVDGIGKAHAALMGGTPA